MDKIAIIGLGLIGTSMGLAIRQTGNKNLEIVGIDLEPSNASTARKMGAVDRDVRSIPEAVRDAKVVIVAIPVLAIRETLRVSRRCPHARHHRNGHGAAPRPTSCRGRSNCCPRA